MEIILNPRDVKHLMQGNQYLTVEALPLPEFLEKQKLKKPKPDTVYYIAADEIDLGYQPVAGLEDAVLRVVKRLGTQRRFWTRPNLSSVLFDRLHKGDVKEQTIKDQISRSLTTMVKNGFLLPVDLTRL